ncbi:MAG: SCO1664 family protein [Actinobacteria bacterium]|nr:SCO1664 family protein [Actinomycetota bacterium]
MELLGLLPRASNSTFLARVCSEDRETLAVYKPRSGEAPLWDFPDGTLYRREVAAYVVARALGWPAVPPTVAREGPEGPGSVQLFVEMDPAGEHYLTLRGSHDFRRVAAFDVLVNNADRKSGHCLLDREGMVFVVDHGVSFSAEPKLRTVIWEFAGDAIPEDIAADIRRFTGRLGTLRAELEGLLARREVDALAGRAEGLLAAGMFPHPGPGRPFPWPVV